MDTIFLNGIYVNSDTCEPLTGEFYIPDYGGVKAHLVNGIIHRDPKEGPALVDFMGTKHYIVNGRLDRFVFLGQTEIESPKIKITIKNRTISNFILN